MTCKAIPEHLACTQCSLANTPRIQVVPGHGRVDATIAFVAEAPGRDESKQGEPLVGKAGVHFNVLLRQAGMERGEVWLDNVVHCRPPANQLGNYPDARAKCPGLWMLPQLASMEGLKVVVSMGATAGSIWFPANLRVRQLQGMMRSTPEGYVVLATYHPSGSLHKGGAYDGAIVSVMRVAKEISEVEGHYL